MGWRAYYAGGVTFDSAETRVAELPDGILGVVEFLEPPYRKLVYGGDYLYMDDGRWYETDSLWGDWVDPPEHVPPELVKRGKGLADGAWEKIKRAMLADREWPDAD